MTSDTERPLRRDAERNRQRILEAAGEVFAKRGLDATMDDIADHAGVGVGTVYRRFPDKELLIDALFEERIGALAAIAEQALTEQDPWNGLVMFLEQGLAQQSVDRGLKELVLGSHHGRERVAQARARMKPLVDQLVERAKAEGKLRDDVESTDFAVIHLMLGAVVDFTEPVVPATWRRFLDIVLEGLRPRSGASALKGRPLGDDELDAAMGSWPWRYRT